MSRLRTPSTNVSKALRLTPGAERRSPTSLEELERIAVLRAMVQKYLPEFVIIIKESGADVGIIHQDAFAAGYDTDEYTLLGMAVKYAGLHGKTEDGFWSQTPHRSVVTILASIIVLEGSPWRRSIS